MKITDVEVLILEAPGDYAAPAGAEEAYGFKHLAASGPVPIDALETYVAGLRGIQTDTTQASHR